MSEPSDEKLQNEEIEALSSIYFNEFSVVEPDSRLQAPSLDRTIYESLCDHIELLVISGDGSPVVFTVVEAIRAAVQSDVGDSEPNCNDSDDQLDDKKQQTVRLFPEEHDLSIYHGDVLTDRRSQFQAHCCAISSVDDVSKFVSLVKTDRKVASATHNILAWRFIAKSANGSSSIVASDCDDDGESHAGARLLHLLTMSGAEGVAVMVSRWFGGILLGPDRFKHINNVARQLLLEKGFICKNKKIDKKKYENTLYNQKKSVRNKSR